MIGGYGAMGQKYRVSKNPQVGKRKNRPSQLWSLGIDFECLMVRFWGSSLCFQAQRGKGQKVIPGMVRGQK